MNIRPMERPADLGAIDALNAAAFAEHGGTKAFDKFRAERDDILALVATEGDQLLGHVLFSPVILDSPAGKTAGMGLGQLAVSPARQKQGIGTALSNAGIRQLRSRGCPFVIVIGHASYYPRLGFERGSLHNVRCQWEGVPDDSFMVLITDPRGRDIPAGTAYFDGM